MGSKIVHGLLASAALFAAACAPVEPPAGKTGAVVVNVEPDNAEAATRAIAQAMRADSIPGMAVAVLRGDDVVWSEGFGAADLELNVAATPETKFRLGSVAKVMTADIAAMLAEDGVVDLDKDIRAYLPQFPDKGAAITLRQLLGHLGGIRHYASKDHDFTAPGGPIDVRIYPDAESILAIFAEDPLVAEPGEAFNYSTFGYSLIGLVLEAASGKDYETLLQEKLLGPAGINDIVVDDMFALVENRAGYYDNIEDYEGLLDPKTYGEVVNAFPLNSAYKIPAGGLTGNAEAVAAFGALHYAPGFFSQAVYEDLFRVQKTSGGEETDTALGWRVGADGKGRRMYSHSGSQQGGRAFVAIYPEERLTVALLSNMGGRPDDIAALSQRVAAPFLP